MSETKLLNCILTEGTLLIILGFSTLLLPKITPVSFGDVLCFAFIVYGGYKSVNAFLTRYFSEHYIVNIISGVLIFTAGLTLLATPFFNPVWITSILSIYFITESIVSWAFVTHTKDILNLTFLLYFTGFMQFLFSIILISLLPSGALWLAGVFAGFNFLISGVILINMYFASNK